LDNYFECGLNPRYHPITSQPFKPFFSHPSSDKT
jgi:hypothetical protein